MKKELFLLLFILLVLVVPTKVMADYQFTRGIINLSYENRTYVYESASTSSNKLTSDTNAFLRLYYPESIVILGEEGNFYKIYFQYTGFYYTGYVLKSVISDVVKVNVSDEIINNLINKGFPRDYAEKLAPLQALHSNWTFNPLNIVPTWNNVINGEYGVKSRNLISSSANPYFRSTDDEVYNNGVYKTFDNGKWYAASKQTIKYYMDARNFINESHLFMFEKLGSEGTNVSKDTIQNILNGTFMQSQQADYSDYAFNIENGVVKYYTYADTILAASSQSKVNAVHLATRIIQEQGVNGTTLSSGKEKDGVIYYNFFNVNARGNSTKEIITNGINRAQSENWNSSYASILGGATFLSNDYISVGQDTLYFQKFDVVGSTYYSRQYMQNIRAPYTESYSTYTTYYQKSLINMPFIFDIPIYSGMPIITTLGPEGNDDNTLSSLSITGCNLMPSFISNATNYSCNVTLNTASVTVSAKPTTSIATMSGTGQITLPSNETKIEISVTSASGLTKVYTVTIKKIDSTLFTPAEIISNLNLNNDIGYISGLNIGSTIEDIINTIAYNFPSVVINNGNVGNIKTGMKFNLANNGSANYTIVLYGDLNGTGNIDILDLLKIQKHLIKTQSLTDAYLKAADVNKDGSVNILDLLVIQKNILGVSQITQ